MSTSQSMSAIAPTIMAALRVSLMVVVVVMVVVTCCDFDCIGLDIVCK
jgi:hypothetical protein